MPKKRKDNILEEKPAEIKPIEKYISPTKQFTVALTIDGEEFPIKVKSRLTIDEAESFLEAVVDSTNQDGMLYLSKDFMIGIQTILWYTDIEIPEDAEMKYQLISSTDIVERIISHEEFGRKQYESILKAIDNHIEFESNRQLVDIRSESERFLAEFKEECNQITESLKGLAKISENITPEQFQGFITSMQNGFDERKVVDAVLDKQKKTGGKKPKVIEMKPDGNV